MSLWIGLVSLMREKSYVDPLLEGYIHFRIIWTFEFCAVKFNRLFWKKNQAIVLT
jgi:hypothetical protein